VSARVRHLPHGIRLVLSPAPVRGRRRIIVAHATTLCGWLALWRHGYRRNRNLARTAVGHRKMVKVLLPDR
jgi:hypothetical protein